jgi:hypothetical protein
VQGIRECRDALKELRSLYVKPSNEFVRYPREGDDLEHDYSLMAEDQAEVKQEGYMHV